MTRFPAEFCSESAGAMSDFDPGHENKPGVYGDKTPRQIGTTPGQSVTCVGRDKDKTPGQFVTRARQDKDKTPGQTGTGLHDESRQDGVRAR